MFPVLENTGHSYENKTQIWSNIFSLHLEALVDFFFLSKPFSKPKPVIHQYPFSSFLGHEGIE